MGLPEGVPLALFVGDIRISRNIDAVTKSLEHLATDRNLATQLGEHGSKMASEQFTLQAHIDRLMQIYRHTINHHFETVS